MDTPTQTARGVTADLPGDAVWRKSSYSGTHGNCVGVASNLPGIVAVRDSKDPDGGELVLSVEAWRALTTRIRAGEFGG